MRTPVSIGIANLGAAGSSFARAFSRLPQAELRWLYDPRPEVLLAARRPNGETRISSRVEDLLADDGLDAIVLAGPLPERFALASAALKADKHVLVVPPMAHAPREAEELLRRAERGERLLMTASPLLNHAGVMRLKELVQGGGFGDIYYMQTLRSDPSRGARGNNLLWDLASNELAVFLDLLADQPIEASARGETYVQPGIADVVSCFLRFATGITAQLHVSWLEGRPESRLTVVGNRLTVVFDALDSRRPLTVYEKALVQGRSDDEPWVEIGDALSPRIPENDPLEVECEQFVAAIRSGGTPGVCGPREGAALVAVLDGLQRSMDQGGAPVPVAGPVRLAPPPVLRLSSRTH